MDPTSLGDTYMAAYVTKRMETLDPETCGIFASNSINNETVKNRSLPRKQINGKQTSSRNLILLKNLKLCSISGKIFD